MSVLPAKSADPARKCFYDGTHRVVSPGATLARVTPLFPRVGITRVANITGLDRIGIPVSMVCRPNARSLSVSQGKGADLLTAKASAVMESIETYHAEHVLLPLKLASHEELQYTHSIAVPETLPQRSNASRDLHVQLLWVEGRDLVADRSKWIPFELVHLNATLDSLPGEGTVIGSSSGLASGNHILEAISHGICELVERDALALWRLCPGRNWTRLDLNSIDDPSCLSFLEKFFAAGITVGVWDVTSDIGIATFNCCLLDDSEERLDPTPVAMGSGCHPSRAVALSRALTEAAQCRATLIAGTRDDLSAKDYEYLYSADAAQPWRRLLQDSAELKFQETPDFTSDSLQGDTEWEIQRLHRCGLNQVIVVDLTKPELQIPVARMVIPGLEPDEPDRRLGPRSLAMLERQLPA